MLFLDSERGNNFTIFTNPTISDVRSANKLAKLHVPNNGMTALEHRVKLSFDFDFALYKFC